MAGNEKGKPLAARGYRQGMWRNDIAQPGLFLNIELRAPADWNGHLVVPIGERA